MAAGSLPALRVLGTIGLGVGAFELGWKIGRTIDTQFLHLSGSIGTTASQTGGGMEVVPIRWYFAQAGDQIPGLSSGFKFGVTGWHANWNESSGGPYVSSYLMGSPVGLVAAGFGGAGTWVADQAANGVTYTIPEAAMPNKLAPAMEPWTSQPADVTTTHTPGGETTITDAEKDAGVIEFESPDGTGSAWGDHVLDPDYDDPLHPNVTWLKPERNETATAYRTRLIAAGLLGATVTVGDPYDAPQDGYGPSAPVRIIVRTPAGVTVRVLDPLLWPVPDPSWPDNYETEIVPNSPDAVPVDDAEVSCPCPIDPIDLSPLTDLDAGEGFPFGTIAWAVGVIDTFNVTPEAPHIEWNVVPGGVDTPLGHVGTGALDFNVDLGGENMTFLATWMGYVRTFVSFLLWAGGLWWFATRTLKWSWSGDPSDAIDEAYEFTP